MRKKYKCKYCGANTTSGMICNNCADKLKRIRTIKAMLLGCTVEDVVNMQKRGKNNVA